MAMTTYKDLGYNNLLQLKDVKEESDRAYQQQADEERKDQESKERLRIQRLAASGNDSLTYTLDEIIRICVMNEGNKSIRINFDSLGFANNYQEVVNTRKLFIKLKKAECFKFVEFRDTKFIITKPSIEKLTEYKEKLIKRHNNILENKSNLNENMSTKINKLFLVSSDNSNQFKVIINEDYKNPIEVDKTKKGSSWDLLFRIAEGEKIQKDDEKFKHTLDYLNTNKRCKLYTKSKCNLTTILKISGGEIIPNVEIGVITERKYKIGLNKLLKTT